MARWSVEQAVLLAVGVMGTTTIIITTPVEAATTILSLRSAISVARAMGFTITLPRSANMSNGRLGSAVVNPVE
uniref:Putative secreted peptide n=1 Tax=Anopheles braziliensis TaxID=58242 RepID=A0A2M3ZUA3_9DIPT